MSKILRIGWKDVLVLLGDRAALLLIIGGPLVLTLGLGLVTGSFSATDNSGISQIQVLVVNEDEGALGEALLETMTSDDLASLLAVQTSTNLATAREAAQAGDVATAIWIPAGFSAGMLPNPETGATSSADPIILYADPGRPISGGVVESVVNQFTNGVTLDVVAVQIAMANLAPAVAPDRLPELGQTLQSAVSATPRETAPLNLVTGAEANEETSFDPLAYFAPAMAMLFLMYTVTLGARSFLEERNRKTLARIMATPIRPSQVIGGKVLGIFLSGFAQVGFLILLSALMFGLRWGSPAGVVLIIAAAALAATGWGVLVSTLATTPGQVSAIGTTLMLGFGILGGSFVPLSESGPVLDALSKLTPNAWALDGFTALAEGGGLATIVPIVGALLVMAVVLFALSAFIFRQRQSTLLAG